MVVYKMKISTLLSKIKQNSRGDTIVEVLISMTILALVMGTAYVVSNHSLQTGTAAGQRNQALGYAQSQIEFIKKAQTDSDATTLAAITTGTTDFCFSTDGALVPVPPGSPATNSCLSYDNQTYTIRVTYNTSLKVFVVNAWWSASNLSAEQSHLVLYYKLPSDFPPPPPTSDPPTVNLSTSYTHVTSGHPTNLYWSSQDTTSCTAQAVPSDSLWTGSKILNKSFPGQLTSALTVAHTYTLTCTGPGGIASDSVTVTVTGGGGGGGGGGGCIADGGGGQDQSPAADPYGEPVAPGRGAGAVVEQRVRLRRARRHPRHRLQPDAAEEEPRRAGADARQDRARGRILVALLTVMKGLPLTYNRDMQEDKEPVFDAFRTMRDCLEVLTGAIASLRVDRERMAAAAGDPLLLATDLAEALVRERVPFREAHEAVGRIVAHCLEKDLDLRRLSREDLRAFHPAFAAGAAELVGLERSLEARDLPGGTARARVAAALERAEREIAAEDVRLEAAERAEAEESR